MCQHMTYFSLFRLRKAAGPGGMPGSSRERDAGKFPGQSPDSPQAGKDSPGGSAMGDFGPKMAIVILQTGNNRVCIVC